MNFVRGLVADLKEKRLLPVAIALVVGLVAIPIVLSDPADEQGGPAAPSADGGSLLGGNAAALLGETKPVVSVGSDGGFRKHVARLARKNPFVQQARAKGQGSEGLQLPTGTTGSSSTSPSTTVPTPPTGTTTPSTPNRLYRYVANVKFGQIGETKSKTVSPAEFMPSEQNPVVLFLGADDDAKNALFLVSPDVTARGDGVCVPSDTKCQIVRMRAGDTEFFEVPVSSEDVVTYELELTALELKPVNPDSSQVKRSQRIQRLNASGVQKLRQAMRTRHVFETLSQLGL